MKYLPILKGLLNICFYLEFTAYFHQVDRISYYVLCFLDHGQINHTYFNTSGLALDTL